MGCLTTCQTSLQLDRHLWWMAEDAWQNWWLGHLISAIFGAVFHQKTPMHHHEHQGKQWSVRRNERVLVKITFCMNHVLFTKACNNYLDLYTCRNNDWPKGEGMWTDGCDDNGRNVGVNHGGTCGRTVGGASGRSGNDETWEVPNVNHERLQMTIQMWNMLTISLHDRDKHVVDVKVQLA